MDAVVLNVPCGEDVHRLRLSGTGSVSLLDHGPIDLEKTVIQLGASEPASVAILPRYPCEAFPPSGRNLPPVYSELSDQAKAWLATAWAVRMHRRLWGKSRDRDELEPNLSSCRRTNTCRATPGNRNSECGRPAPRLNHARPFLLQPEEPCELRSPRCSACPRVLRAGRRVERSDLRRRRPLASWSTSARVRIAKKQQSRPAVASGNATSPASVNSEEFSVMQEGAHGQVDESGGRLFISASEVGQQLGLRKSRVYELAAGGLLPCVRLGRRIWFPGTWPRCARRCCHRGVAQARPRGRRGCTPRRLSSHRLPVCLVASVLKPGTCRKPHPKRSAFAARSAASTSMSATQC